MANPSVYFNVLDVTSNPLTQNVELTPVRFHGVTGSYTVTSSYIISGDTVRRCFIDGIATFETVVPNHYRATINGPYKDTVLFIRVPSGSLSSSLNAKDLIFPPIEDHGWIPDQANSASYGSTSSYVPYDGNRPIKRNDPVWQGVNVGGQDVVTFLNNFFFPFVPASISINSGVTYYQTGSSQNISVIGTTTVNDETTIGTASISRDGVQWQANVGPYIFTSTDNGVITDHSYIAYVQAGNGVINSGTKTVSFLYPFLYGTSPTAGLSGTALYNALTKDVSPQIDKTISLNSVGTYIYFAYPSNYDVLTEILDPNLFNMISSFQYSSSISVTSTGLTNNWTRNYKVYRLELVADPNGDYQFIF